MLADPYTLAYLARHSDFARLWAAQTTSAIGSQFTAVALPLLAALSLGASPMAFGVLAAAAGLPHLLFGLLAGAWVDRLRRRPVMIAADVARAVLLITIPVTAALGALRIELLVAIAFLVETFTVFFDIAYLTFIPSLVSREDLVEANSRLEATASGAQVIGPALGGTLVQDIGTQDHWHSYTTTELDAGSRIAKAMGTETPNKCHCVHHQALDRLGAGLQVVGRHVSGMIHAVELDAARWVVGIQWHPEDSAAEDPQQQGLFDELIRQAT